MSVNTKSLRRWNARNVTAVLGPTNTGKTHLAIERMLGHESGVIGLPLRLLAREVYNRVVARAGADRVALVTGEEKIVPREPRYSVCTVEAMPRETDAAFVAIDEVQISGDLERGHIFTDRLLNLRGTQETLLLGAATMRGIIEQLLPGVHVVTRPRMSVLAYAGQKKITRLPERSAIVTFSAGDVYAIAELIRRQRGGAAVVLGALSPRTRNKQVEIYQAGDVDFLVATDAIGMGLNLDVDHVAFAADRKFDGYQHRPLTAAELGQVAGRAGRHMRDGTFGVTARVTPFPDELVEALESHRFEPVRSLQWREDQLDFASVQALVRSLDRPATVEGLTKAPPADDQAALEALSRDEDVMDRVLRPADVRRLWDVCRLPDYRKIAPAQHAQLVATIFTYLMDEGTVPDEWMATQICQSNRTDGDIDTLSARIAHIRTWTFVANQPDWLKDPAAWRGEASAAEDALSDALHDMLTKRFVDRRTSVLMRRLRENTMLEAEITATGDVLVEGQHVGQLQGFRFTPDARAEGADAKAVRGAAQKALGQALDDRAERLAKAGDREIVLSSDYHLRWGGEPVARVAAGDDTLRARVILLADEQLSPASREAAQARLDVWLKTHIETLLKPLVDLSADVTLSPMARGLAFRLKESFGILDRRSVLEDVRSLDQEARAGLRRHGVRFGAYHIYVPALLKPGPAALLAQLWALRESEREPKGLGEVSAASSSGRTSMPVNPALDAEVYARFGFRVYGQRAVRIDILERLADLIRPALSWRAGATGDLSVPQGAVPGGGFTVTPAMTSLLGASGEDMAVILKGLGYRMERKPMPPPPALAVENSPAQTVELPDVPVVVAAEAEADQTAEPGETTQPGEMPEPDTFEPEVLPVEEPPVEEPTVEPPAEQPLPEELPQEVPPLEVPIPGEAAAAEPPVEVAPPEMPVIETSAEAAAEPATIEVWRPGGSGGRRPKRSERNAGPRQRSDARPQGERPQRNARRQGQNTEVRPHGDARPQGESPPQGDGRGENRRDGESRKDRKPRRGPPRPPEGREAERRPEPARWERREKPLDPDSPFAALAALKQQLTRGGR